jgi:hypothetical protein
MKLVQISIFCLLFWANKHESLKTVPHVLRAVTQWCTPSAKNCLDCCWNLSTESLRALCGMAVCNAMMPLTGIQLAFSSCPYECLGNPQGNAMLMEMWKHLEYQVTDVKVMVCGASSRSPRSSLQRNPSSGVTTGCPPQCPWGPITLCPKPSPNGFHLNLHTWHYIPADLTTTFNTMRLQNLSINSNNMSEKKTHAYLFYNISSLQINRYLWN